MIVNPCSPILLMASFFILIPFWTFYVLYTAGNPAFPSLQEALDENHWVWDCIVAASILMFNRVVQRAIAVFRIYGFWSSMLSIPLILYANIINLHSLLRAYVQFIFAPKSKSGPVKWEKTDHVFPAPRMLQPYRKRLGNLLIENKYITHDQLEEALNIQAKTGEQLGTVLQQLGYIDQKQFTTVLSKQLSMDIIHPNHVIPLPFEVIKKLSRYAYDSLIKNHSIPISIDNDELSIAISDPSNEVKLARIIKLIEPYKARFVLVSE